MEKNFVSPSELEYWRMMAERLRAENSKLKEKLEKVVAENQQLKRNNSTDAN